MRIIKRVMSLLSVISMSAVISLSTSVSAVYYDFRSAEYNVNNSEYKEYIDMLGFYLPHDEVFTDGYNDYFVKNDAADYQYKWFYKHFFVDPSADKTALVINRKNDNTVFSYVNAELGRAEDIEAEIGKTRMFSLVRLEWSYMVNTRSDVDAQDVNSFIEENHFSASAFDTENGLQITYSDEITADEILEIALALNKEFGLLPTPVTFEEDGTVYTDEIIATESTLLGDADLNGEVGIADVVAVSKHNINSTAYPLANETAEANADMNNDNVVDGLDASALVEYNLGKK